MPSHRFPKNFTWGTATSAYQIEGNNSNTDWWGWEQSKDYRVPSREYPLDPSGVACDSYNRYEEDFNLCLELNNNAVRFSIEWARIEPDEGVFSEREIEHYREVLMAARRRGLKTFVTLHHFTNPKWFAKKGGWTNLKSPDYFALYCKKVAKEFGELIDCFLTINEPQVFAYMSYTNGTWPPNKSNPFLSLLVQINMMRGHKKAYKVIKKECPDSKIGIVKNIVWYECAHKWAIWDRTAVKLLYWLGSDFYLRPLMKHLDLIGVNYYFTNRIRHFRRANLDDRVNDLGWWMDPSGIQKILVDVCKYGKPVYVTENGLADAKDSMRKNFLRDMLKNVSEAVKRTSETDNALIKGYFHWSLLDNYEWHHGFWPRFGLVEIDRENNLARKPRPSFYYYANIAKENAVSDDIN